MALPVKTVNILRHEITQQKGSQNDTCVYLISESRKTILPINEEFRLEEIKKVSRKDSSITTPSEMNIIVQTANLTTEVLGTSFLVSSYKNSDTVNVSLVSGKVNVYNGNNSITLSQGKGITVNTSIN